MYINLWQPHQVFKVQKCRLLTKHLAIVLSLSQLQALDDNLAALTEEFETATAAKLKCQQQAEATANTISLANRYHTRWVVQLLYNCEQIWQRERRPSRKWHISLIKYLTIPPSLPSFQVGWWSSLRESPLGRVSGEVQAGWEDAGWRCAPYHLLPLLCGLLWEILPYWHAA